MASHLSFPRALGWPAGVVGLSALAYVAYVLVSWSRYGHARSGGPEEADPLLDRFIPDYEVAERHHVQVSAPAEIALSAAADTDLQESPIVRAIFRMREVVLGARPDAVTRPRGLLAQTTSLGWGVLAEVPGREIVVGAVTQPWQANVVFHPLSPAAFRDFLEPGFVKIVWTLRADPLSSTRSIFRTETRVATTDLEARRRFRWYWARFSPGIVLIRRVMLGQLRTEAERRVKAAASLSS